MFSGLFPLLSLFSQTVYLQLAADLTDAELHTLIGLISSYNEGQLGLLEYLQKIVELYGPQRRHLICSQSSVVRG